MAPPDSSDRQYSTRLRTALVLSGSGTAGAYQAGVLRALHEAGIKIDLVAGRGAGVIGAMFSAMDGGSRLWDDNGVWRRPAAANRYYPWRGPLRDSRLGSRGCRCRPRASNRAPFHCDGDCPRGHAPDVCRPRVSGRVRECRVQPVDRDALRARCGANLRAALCRARPSDCRRVGGRERRGIGLLEPREAPVRPRSRRSRHRRARCPRRRSSRTAAPSSGT